MKLEILSKLIYYFGAVPIKSPTCGTEKMTVKCIWKGRGPWIAKSQVKEE